MVRALSLALLIAAHSAIAGDEVLSERVDLLLDQLTTGGLSMSRSATVALQSLGEEGRKILLDRLRSKDPFERRRAVLGLGALGKKEGAGPILELVDDPDPGVRTAAVSTLGHLRAEGAFRPLLARLDDPDGGVRAAAVAALADLGSSQAVKPILLLALDPDAEVRSSVAFAIGRLGDRSAGTLLCLAALARDESGRVRRKAAVSLGEVGDRSVVEDIVFGFSDDDPWVRSASARSLGKIASAADIAPLRDTALRQAQDTALRLLRGLLADEDSFVRAAAAETLGDLGDRGSIGDLAPLLDDEDPSGVYLFTSMRELSVAEVAAFSLGRITGDNLGYERELPAEKRERALARWRRWRAKTVESVKLKGEGEE